MTVYFNTQKYEGIKNFDWENFNGSLAKLNTTLNEETDISGEKIVRASKIKARIKVVQGDIKVSALTGLTLLAAFTLLPVLSCLPFSPIIGKMPFSMLAELTGICSVFGLFFASPFFILACVNRCKKRNYDCHKLTKEQLTQLKDEWLQQVHKEYNKACELHFNEPLNPHYREAKERLGAMLPQGS